MIGCPPTTTSSSSCVNSRMVNFPGLVNENTRPTPCGKIIDVSHKLIRAICVPNGAKIVPDRHKLRISLRSMVNGAVIRKQNPFYWDILPIFADQAGRVTRMTRSLASKNAGRCATMIRVIGRSRMTPTMALSVSTSRLAVPSSRNSTAGS